MPALKKKRVNELSRSTVDEELQAMKRPPRPEETETRSKGERVEPIEKDTGSANVP